MVDQAEALRRLVLQRAGHEMVHDRRGGVLVVLSLGAGAGGTTVARHMALSLYRHAWPVGLVEVLPDQASEITQVPTLNEPDWTDVATGRRTLREAWRPGLCGLPTVRRSRRPRITGGLLPGDCLSVVDGPLVEDEAGLPSETGDVGLSLVGDWGVEQLRQAARGQWIVVDAGHSDTARGFLEIADECCLVLDADPQRTTDQYAEIKRLVPHLRGARCWLLINRTRENDESTAIRQRLIATADRFLNLALMPLGELPEERDGDLLECGRSFMEAGVPSAWRTAMRRVVMRWEEALASPQASSMPS